MKTIALRFHGDGRQDTGQVRGRLQLLGPNGFPRIGPHLQRTGPVRLVGLSHD